MDTTLASPEARDFSDYPMDRAILLDSEVTVSDGAYSLLTNIFSPRPERRPSLAEIRREVFAMPADTFQNRTAFGIASGQKHEPVLIRTPLWLRGSLLAHYVYHTT
jgi:hypothetical protein